MSNGMRAVVWGQKESAAPHRRERDGWMTMGRKRHIWVYYYEILDEQGNILASDNTCGWRGIYDACLDRMKRIALEAKP